MQVPQWSVACSSRRSPASTSVNSTRPEKPTADRRDSSKSVFLPIQPRRKATLLRTRVSSSGSRRRRRRRTSAWLGAAQLIRERREPIMNQIVIIIPPRVARDAPLAGSDARRLDRAVVHCQHDQAADPVQHVAPDARSSRARAWQDSSISPGEAAARHSRNRSKPAGATAAQTPARSKPSRSLGQCVCPVELSKCRTVPCGKKVLTDAHVATVGSSGGSVSTIVDHAALRTSGRRTGCAV